MSWDELVAAALIGTDRRPVAAGVPEGSPPGLQGALESRGVEDRLLGAAAAWTVARRAGAIAGAAVEVDPVEEDPRPIAPATALHQRLDGHYPQLLPEWLALAAERGLRPPPELVPALLDHAAVDPSLHAAVGAAAGPLGRWLAERRSHWAFVHGAGEDVEEIWAEGGSDERRALFERLRGSDPAAGRALLERTFADETWEDRAAFVETLATGLSDADEPLLELALDDRRKPVRDAAAHLLAGPPALALRRPHGPSAPPRCCASRAGGCEASASSSNCPATPTAPPSATASRWEVAAPNACTRCWPRRRWRRGRARSGSRRPRRR